VLNPLLKSGITMNPLNQFRKRVAYCFAHFEANGVKPLLSVRSPG
jgi:hypothetical protein